MGVHADAGTYKQVKALLEIPEDEPIFIFRAQDELCGLVISYYHSMYFKSARQRNLHMGNAARLTPEQQKFAGEVLSVEEAVFGWQETNSDKVKFPD